MVFPWGQCTGTSAPCSAARTTSYWTYDPGNRTWTTHPVDLELPSSVNGAYVVGDNLVISWLAGSKTLGAAVVDLRTERVSMLATTPVAQQRPVPAAAGSLVFWSRDPDNVWFLDPVTDTWPNVAQPTAPGPLSPDKGVWPISVGHLVALNGHLYDPTSRLWSPVPQLPVPASAPVIVGGSDTALACYGYNTARASYNDTCYLLTPAPATQPTP